MAINIYIVLEFLARYVWPVVLSACFAWLFWPLVRSILVRVGLLKRPPTQAVHRSEVVDSDDAGFDMRDLPSALWQPGRKAIGDTHWMFHDKQDSGDFRSLHGWDQDH